MSKMNGAAPASSNEEYKVRLAVEDDIPQLVALGRDLHAENGLMPLSEAKIWNIASMAASRDRAKSRITCGCIGPVGNIEAMIFLCIGNYWYTEQNHLEDLFLYVRPQFRRSTRAKYLIQFAKNCADDLKLPLIFGVLSNDRTEAKVSLYERQLGKRAGCYWIYNGKTGR